MKTFELDLIMFKAEYLPEFFKHIRRYSIIEEVSIVNVEEFPGYHAVVFGVDSREMAEQVINFWYGVDDGSRDSNDEILEDIFN